jgi:tight adherence protein B
VEIQTLSVFGLAAFAVGGLLWVFVYPILSGERKTEQRMASVARTEPVALRTTRTTQKSRRDTVESTLKEIEQRHKKQKRMPLNIRIQQAGLSWSKRQFYIVSGIIAAVLFVSVLVSGAGLIPAAALGFAGAFGLPRWLLSYLKKRRETRFLDAFPDAVDVIVRGIKAGLPLLDSIKVITADSPEPVRSEFRAIIECIEWAVMVPFRNRSAPRLVARTYPYNP